MQLIIILLGGCSQLQQWHLPRGTVAAAWHAHPVFVEGAWECKPQSCAVAAGIFRGTSKLSLLFSSLEGCMPGDSYPFGKPLFGRALLLNKQPWTTFGTGIKGTYFCCSHTESFFWKCKVSMQAGEKHLLSCFQSPCHKWTEKAELLHAQGDLTQVLSTGGQLPQKCWKSYLMGQGNHGFF